MASTISTHALDTVRGAPAVGLAVVLERFVAGGTWAPIAEATTDEDGRAGPFDPGLEDGSLRLVFATRDYWSQGDVPSFFPEVSITFEPPASGHCHVPLLLSPYGYTTYRGS